METSLLLTTLGVIWFAFQQLTWFVVGDGISGDQNPQFTPLQCNNTVICAVSQPVTFMYSVLSVTTCAVECYFKQYLSAPCVGFNYRATNNSCDIFNDDSLFFSKDQVGCQYYQRTGNTISNCTQLPGLQSTTLVTSITEPDHVVSTAIVSEQLFVTLYNVAKVFVYNTTSYQLLREITFTGLGRVLFGLAASDNYLFISDSYNGNYIHRVDLSVTNNVNVVTWTMQGAPYGLSMTINGNLLAVIDYFSGTFGEYTPGGSLVRKINVNQNTWHVVEVNKNVWAFSHGNGLCTTFKDGTMIKCYGMNDPRWMAVDSRGYIIVAERGNNRILTVNPSLTESHPLSLPVSTSLQLPICLSLDQSRGRLYVGEDGGQQRVLVFDGM